MIKYCLDKWNKNQTILEEALRADTSLNECDYKYLVKMIVSCILNGDVGDDYHETRWSDAVTVVDNGDYQGTLLFLIPQETYQPCAAEYLMSFTEYGSCSGCDVLQGIQGYSHEPPTEKQLKEYMGLCRDIVCNMIKPYNFGWRNSPDFEPVEFEND